MGATCSSAPDQQPGEGDRLGVKKDVAIGFRAGQLTEHRALRMGGSIDQHDQRQHDAQGNAQQDAQRARVRDQVKPTLPTGAFPAQQEKQLWVVDA